MNVYDYNYYFVVLLNGNKGYENIKCGRHNPIADPMTLS